MKDTNRKIHTQKATNYAVNREEEPPHIFSHGTSQIKLSQHKTITKHLSPPSCSSNLVPQRGQQGIATGKGTTVHSVKKKITYSKHIHIDGQVQTHARTHKGTFPEREKKKHKRKTQTQNHKQGGSTVTQIKFI